MQPIQSHGAALRASHQPERTALHGIQALRFVAAAMVVLEHVREAQPFGVDPLPAAPWLQGGVDAFFVISGFIMVSIVTPDTTFGQFWLRRFTRIAPLYWLVTAVAFFGGLLAPDWFFGAHDPWFAVRSALFLPLGENVDAVRPLLAPGWTLIFEFAFYSIIALCLAVRRPPFALASMTTGVLLVVSMVVWPFAHQLGYYAFKLVMLEFLFGIALGAVVHRIRLPAWLGFVLAAAGFTAIAMVWDAPAGYPRGIVVGIPATLVVAGFILSEPYWANAKPLLQLARLGNASYAIYLVHPFLVAFISTLLRKNETMANALGPYGYTLTAIAAGLLVGVLVHVFVEKPLLRLVRSALPRGQNVRLLPVAVDA